MSEPEQDTIEETEVVEKEEINVFDLSEEDLAAYGEKLDASEGQVSEVDTDIPVEEETPVKEEETVSEGDVPIEVEKVEEDSTEDESETAEENTETDPVEKVDEKETKDSEIDYKAGYDKILAPFKANGGEIQAKSVDDAIQLMQMGAGYHKKMASLKPALKQMKLLEKHGLLDDEKLNYLIDLSTKQPEAIKKLLKDSDIDPLDIDVNVENNYTPTKREVSETEIKLDEVFSDIKDTPTFQRTVHTLTKEWDTSSKNTIANEPEIIKTINGHMQDGIFDVVMKRVDYERSLGRLSGVSDFDAYKQTGNALADEGVLQRPGNPVTKAEPIQVPEAKSSKAEIDRKARKKAASPTKGSKAAVAAPKNPLEMSDEELEKFDIDKYLKL